MEGRIIGRYEGQKPGPVLLCIGGIHGNEPAGVLAIREVLERLKQEKINRPEFEYHGTLVGILGNTEAFRQQKRFIDRDLNRMLSREEIERILLVPTGHRTVEEQQCLELVECIEREKRARPDSPVLLIDLHTTTASGGLFSIAADDDMSLQLAKGLHVPVILGIAHGLKGTTLDYFNRPQERMHCIVFEAGQHTDPNSVMHSVSAIINCMRSMGAVLPEDVDHGHDRLLKDLAEGLPRVTRLICHYKIHSGEHFRMQPGYKNFDPVRKGDIVAENDQGPVRIPHDGLILMPKYQPQGDDGFFLVEPVE